MAPVLLPPCFATGSCEQLQETPHSRESAPSTKRKRGAGGTHDGDLRGASDGEDRKGLKPLHQNKTFSANCISLGSPALEITPKFAAPKIRPGRSKLA